MEASDDSDAVVEGEEKVANQLQTECCTGSSQLTATAGRGAGKGGGQGWGGRENEYEMGRRERRDRDRPTQFPNCMYIKPLKGYYGTSDPEPG